MMLSRVTALLLAALLLGSTVQQHIEASSTGNRRRIAFVCIVSGDKSLPRVKAELSKAVLSLRPIQSIDIVLVDEKGQAVSLWADPVEATPDNKKKAQAFIDGVQIVCRI